MSHSNSADSYAAMTAVLSDTFGLSEEYLRSGTTLASLDLDSLSVAELTVVMEERAGVRIDDLDPSTTLDEVAQLLDEALTDDDPADEPV